MILKLLTFYFFLAAASLPENNQKLENFQTLAGISNEELELLLTEKQDQGKLKKYFTQGLACLLIMSSLVHHLRFSSLCIGQSFC